MSSQSRTAPPESRRNGYCAYQCPPSARRHTISEPSPLLKSPLTNAQDQGSTPKFTLPSAAKNAKLTQVHSAAMPPRTLREGLANRANRLAPKSKRATPASGSGRQRALYLNLEMCLVCAPGPLKIPNSRSSRAPS